ncbi:MAG: tRNA threonylcarbamoyladenosine dehydratase [Bacteroidales bacterium]|nr:tRNA threonylcarbamoyladenosine dehydratase [Bacteroidales bacterium]
MENWQERTGLLVGEEGIGKLAAASVAVIGLGGVGGFAAEMIARAGVGNILILDSDTVGETNKNRQLLALDSTVGRPKTEVMKARLLDINPKLNLVVIREFLTEENIAGILGQYKIDFLVDAIDTLSPKLNLIKYCMDSGIPLVSSMGAGGKYDATKVRITDLSKSYNCPLAYIVRKKLRKMGIQKGFKVVFSEELPDRDSIIQVEEQNKKSQVGTISYLPAVFGCACAQAAVEYLLNIC